MYVRPSVDNRQKIKIPENYSGHAFRDQSPFGDMPPPTRVDAPPRRDRADVQTSGENTASPMQQNEREDVDSAKSKHEAVSPDNNYEEVIQSAEADSFDKHNVPQKSSIFSSLLPSMTSSTKHFPFGHGIGSEEILILAIMLLVYLSSDGGECDNELILLLGFLLFAG